MAGAFGERVRGITVETPHRELKIEATDALWELERLVSFLTDVDSKFGGLLFFVNANGERQHAEIGGPILPVFTQI